MQLVEYENLARSQHYSYLRDNFKHSAESTRKKINKVYALVINNNILDITEDGVGERCHDVSEGYQILLLVYKLIYFET